MIPITTIKDRKKDTASSALWSDKDERVFPWVTLSLVLANIIVFVIETRLPQSAMNCFALAYSFTPDAVQHGLMATQSVAQGCQNSAFTPPPTIVSLFTAMFLHASILHIAGNMLFLLVFGGGVEKRLGSVGFLLFYLVCGVAASLAETIVLLGAVQYLHVSASVLALPNLGASGAIAGILGAYLISFPRNRILTVIPVGVILIFPIVSAQIVILVWFLLQVLDGVFSLTPAYSAAQGGVAYFAHIGGFLAGLLLARGIGALTRKNVTFPSRA
jgi:membrane associated rhomboid family serine protease